MSFSFLWDGPAGIFTESHGNIENCIQYNISSFEEESMVKMRPGCELVLQSILLSTFMSSPSLAFCKSQFIPSQVKINAQIQTAWYLNWDQVCKRSLVLGKTQMNPLNVLQWVEVDMIPEFMCLPPHRARKLHVIMSENYWFWRIAVPLASKHSQESFLLILEKEPTDMTLSRGTM